MNPNHIRLASVSTTNGNSSATPLHLLICTPPPKLIFAMDLQSELNRIQQPGIRNILEYASREFPPFHTTLSSALSTTPPDELQAWFTRLGALLLDGIRSLQTGQRFPGTSTPGRSRATTPCSRANAIDCLQRDRYQCIITGREKRHGFPIDVAHIIPYSLSNMAECRGEAFWKTLEMFYGVPQTDVMWGLAGGQNVNNVANLFSVDATLHKMFNADEIYLEAYKLRGVRFTPDDFKDNHVVPPYRMQIVFRRAIRPSMITTAKGLESPQDSALPVLSGDYFPIESSNPPQLPLPHPLLINCRAGVFGFLNHFRAAAAHTSYDYQDREREGADCLIESWGSQPLTPQDENQLPVDPNDLKRLLTLLTVRPDKYAPHLHS